MIAVACTRWLSCSLLQPPPPPVPQRCSRRTLACVSFARYVPVPQINSSTHVGPRNTHLRSQARAMAWYVHTKTRRVWQTRPTRMNTAMASNCFSMHATVAHRTPRLVRYVDPAQAMQSTITDPASDPRRMRRIIAEVGTALACLAWLACGCAPDGASRGARFPAKTCMAWWMHMRNLGL